MRRMLFASTVARSWVDQGYAASMMLISSVTAAVKYLADRKERKARAELADTAAIQEMGLALAETALAEGSFDLYFRIS